MRSHLLSIGILCAAACGCAREEGYQLEVAGGDAGRGQMLVKQFGCGACHVIPGVSGARGRVGPPLEHYARRVYVAGKFPNTPDVLVRWLRDPPALAPATAMPAVGVNEKQARDIAAYLYSLR